MQPLKLVALDEEDLGIVSAHVQDAVMKTGDISYHAGEKRLIVTMNRFVWEKKQRLFSREHERRRSVLNFDRVLSVKSSGIDRSRADDILSLLAITFAPADAPAGTVEMSFSGGGTLRLDVECIEARLTDTGSAWKALAKPRHAG